MAGSVTAQVVYNDCCNTLLENSGVTTLGIMTVSDFLNMLNDVLADFLLKTGCITGFFNINSIGGTATYAEPNTAMDVHTVSYGGVFLSRTSTWYLDNYQTTWPSSIASYNLPERWLEDDQPPKTIQIEPIPLTSGVVMQLIATAQPSSYPAALATTMTFIPDTATSYVKYGVLSKIFSGDTEYKDDQRAKYCLQKYQEGVMYFQYLLTEIGQEQKR